MAATAVRAGAPSARDRPGFSHEAVLYAGIDGFVAAVGSFVRAGVEAGEAVLVVAPGDRLEPLARAIGPVARLVEVADMDDAGRNPAAIIGVWQEFVERQLATGRGFRGVGEPAHEGRSPVELVECTLHEALLNLAFEPGPAWRLLCPYAVDALAAHVVDDARATHRACWRDGGRNASDAYAADAIARRLFAAPLDPPPAAAAAMRFAGLCDLRGVREWVLDAAFAAAVPFDRAHDAVLAVSELAANSVRHGGGEGTLRIWNDNRHLVCEVADGGHITDPLAGRWRRPSTSPHGHGLWIVNRLSDLVQLRSGPAGTTARVHVRLP
jgi:anti-sigma regulatory factor (Ser/Thr protein kinase)